MFGGRKLSTSMAYYWSRDGFGPVGFLPFQVVTKFVDHVEEAEAMNPGHGRAEELVAQTARQTAWLKRGRDPHQDQQGLWRPRKKHRVHARNWILYLDNQALVTSMSLSTHSWICD